MKILGNCCFGVVIWLLGLILLLVMVMLGRLIVVWLFLVIICNVRCVVGVMVFCVCCLVWC